MIEDIGGKFRTRFSTQEAYEVFYEELERLTPEEKKIFFQMVKDHFLPEPDQPKLIDLISDADYIRKPVDVETFIKDPYYLGETCGEIYPPLLKDLVTIFEGNYNDIILTGAIGTGKCIHGSTEIFDASTGRRRRADEEGPGIVPSLDSSDRMTYREASFFSSGIKECVELSLASGQSVILSEDHPVLTPTGWQPVGKISLGDVLAIPRKIPEPSKCFDISDAEVRTVAYLCSDGSTTSSIQFTNLLPELISELDQDVRLIGIPSTGIPSIGLREFSNSNSGRAKSFSVNGVRHVVNRWKLNCLAKQKRVPEEFYALSDRQVALFLNRFWACDGYIDVSRRVLEVTLASEKLIDDLQFLLCRLGVSGRKAYKKASYVTESGERRFFDAWRLTISEHSSVSLFLDVVGDVKGHEDKCAKLRSALDQVTPNPNKDLVPVGLSELREIREELYQQGTGVGLLREYGLAGNSKLSRPRFECLCEQRKYTGRYARYAHMEVRWEKVTSLESRGLDKVYDLSVPGTHNFVGNGILLHNTFCASIGACRMLYELSCMKSPHKVLGLAKNSNISILALSVNEQLAIKVAFEYIASKLEPSPYFQEKFPFKKMKKELRFPSNIWVAARATTDTSMLGLNPICAILDEQNFLKKPSKSTKQIPGAPNYDQAESIYNSVKRRMQSRFERKGRNPCKLFMSSSKNTFDDFTARLIRSAKNNSSLYVMDYTPWEVRPDDFEGERVFHVYCGNEATPSKILEEEEVEDTIENCPEGAAVVPVPISYWNDFQRDLEGSIRDIAGRSAASVSHFITRRDKIVESFSGYAQRSHPMTTEVYDMSRPPEFKWKELVEIYEKRTSYGEVLRRLRPKKSPEQMRHIHIDPSLTGDSTGFTMAHVCGYKDVVRRNRDHREYTERAPVYYIDLMLKIIPPIGREIILADVRRLVYELSEHGFLITKVTSDSYQSADTLQQLNSKGYDAELVSVDVSIYPYDTLKLAIYEGRVVGYPYPAVEKELRELEIDRKKQKIDHPTLGSKDVSDSLAGCVWTLSETVSTDALPAYLDRPVYRGDSEAVQQISEPDIIPMSHDSLLEYEPFLMGHGSDPFGDYGDF